MTLQQCKYVLKIREVGTFSEAARQLFVAQSGLSNSVKSLEDELNIKIFERSKNGVALTADGAEFVCYAEQMVAQAEFILDRYGSQFEKDRLYISTQHYDFIADIFCEFLNTCESSHYDISLQEKMTYDVIHDVEMALSDIGIIAIKNRDKDIMMRYLQSKDIRFAELLKTPPHLFVHKNHPLSKNTSIAYDELQKYPYVCYNQGAYNDYSLFTEEMSNEDINEKKIVISDRATLMNVLLKTDCYTIGTGIMPSNLNDGKIVGIPLVTDESYSVGYILKRNRISTPTVDNFIEILDHCSNRLMAINKPVEK